MVHRLAAWLKIDELESDTRAEIAGILRPILATVMGLLVLYFVLLLLNRPLDETRIITVALLFGLCLLAAVVLARGHAVAAGTLLSIGAWLMIVGSAPWLGGMSATGLALLTTIILFVGMLFGRRLSLFFAALSTAAIFTLFLLDRQRTEPYPVHNLGLRNFLIFVTGYLITAMLVYLARRRVDAAVLRARQSRNALADSNRDLLREIQERMIAVEAERRQRQIAESLQQVSVLLGSTLQRQEVLEVILEYLGRFVDYESVSIVLQTNNGVELAARESPGRFDDTPVGTRWDRPLPLQATVMERRAPVYVADTANDARWVKIPKGGQVNCWLGIPLVVKDHTIGLLSMTGENPYMYSDDHIAVATAFAAQAAVAIDNARLYEESQRQTEQLSALYEATLATSSLLDIHQLLKRLHEQAQSLTSFDSLVVMLYDSARREVYVPYVIDEQLLREEMMSQHFPVEEAGLSGWVLTHGATLLIADTASEPLPAKPRAVSGLAPSLSWLGIPLISRGETIGLVSIQALRANAFDAQTQRLLETLVRQFAAAIANARLYDLAQREIDERREVEAQLEEERALLERRVEERTAELQRHYRWQSALVALEPIINSPRDLRSVLDRIATSAAQELPIDGGVSIVTEAQIAGVVRENPHDYVVIARSTSLQDQPMDEWRSAGTTERIISSKQTEVMEEIDPARLSTSTWAQRYGLRSLIGVPLLWQDDCLGVLFVLGRRPFSPSVGELAYLRSLANRAAVAMVNVSLYQALQQANEELVQVAQMKDEFLATVSHELRTPLNAILGLTESLSVEVYGAINARQERALANIATSGQHLLSLINDILDLSKIEAGKMELMLTTISVADVCRLSLEFVSQLAQKKRLHISVVADEAVKTVYADQRRLTQILLNLLSNAVKFTHEGGKVGLEVSGDPAANLVHFAVWDTGIGISEEHLSRLFVPFMQIDSKLARQFEGTGLGLALAKRMTELHGGQITVHSRVGEGSRFVVSLPWHAATGDLVAADHAGTAAPSSEEEVQRPSQ